MNKTRFLLNMHVLHVHVPNAKLSFKHFLEQFSFGMALFKHALILGVESEYWLTD